ncbi:hypothetical protein F4803DRAFT_574546 [Xylaria telfairii]|nr:hypothetical protein F4803DRAFT_574546 [Xylaria telfairii]
MEWISQSEDNIPMSADQYSSGHIGTDNQDQRMLLNISDATGPWSDLMDLTPEFGFDDGTSALINPIETNMDFVVGGSNIIGESTSKPRRTIINDRQKSILTKWVASNPEPYPSKEDKISLANSTGLTVKQINGWFMRIRQRKLNWIHVIGTLTRTEHDSPLSKNLKRKRSVTPEVAWSPQNTHISVSLGIFEDFWPSSASLPGHPRECSTKSLFRKSQSLPPFFTLDFVGQYTSAPSRSSRDRLSPEALVSARRSANSHGSNHEGLKRLATIYANNDRPQYLEDTKKLKFIEVWVADVAKHTFYSYGDDGMLLRSKPDASPAASDKNDYGSLIQWKDPKEDPSKIGWPKGDIEDTCVTRCG